jgi:Ca2+:H+ antiporter
MVFTWLLLFIPLSAALALWVHAGPAWVFACGIAAIVPLAEWMRRGTEQVARRSGTAIGGLLNVTFGNLTELIIALFVLRSGQTNVVKAQIIGSIIGNSLLGLGLAIIVGSWGRPSQRFKRERAGLLSSLLVLSVIGLSVPALFDYTERGIYRAADPLRGDDYLSIGVSIVLIGVYVANLVYTLVTHRDVFEFDEPDSGGRAWPLWQSAGVLAAATVALSFEAELISNVLEAASRSLHLSPFFLGVIVLAIVGNAAEYVSAIYFARRDRMGLVVTITVGSTIQVALFTAPLLVILSRFVVHPMNLVFRNPLELIAITGVALAVHAIAQDGETTWFEGLLLLAVYAIFALAFYFIE